MVVSPHEPEPRFAVSEWTTFPRTFAEDVRAYRDGGAQGIGISEMKLPDGGDEASLALFRDSGLKATICAPAGFSVLPLPGFPGSPDPRERVAAICAGIERLAPFDPIACIALTGPAEEGDAEAHRAVVDGLRDIARFASRFGIDVAVEPLHPTLYADWTIVASLPDAADLLEEVGEPNLKILYDVYHVWGMANAVEDTRRYAPLLAGAVHVSDHREPTRSWADRLLPGDGAIDLSALFGALRAGGYDGWYELEVWSDDGSFGTELPDSLWREDPEVLVARGRRAFLDAWQRSIDEQGETR